MCLNVTMKPEWIKTRAPQGLGYRKTRALLDALKVQTVCESALCPNRGTCFNEGTATFMILGNVCTRNCRFCGVGQGKPTSPDPHEPERVAAAARLLDLQHVVVTSVTRDDLSDGGASFFTQTLKHVKSRNPKASTEVLISDLGGDRQSLTEIVRVTPDILAHNLETVSRLYPVVRPQARYSKSLAVLRHVKAFNPELITKSGIMLGLGEKREEVLEAMRNLRQVDCDLLTIGQYLRPSSRNVEVKEYIRPDVFEDYKEYGYSIGFKYVASAPFVRSSYQAQKTFLAVKNVRVAPSLRVALREQGTADHAVEKGE